MQLVDYNYSFNSAANDSERFKLMFSDSVIASSYQQSASKIKYSIQYGLYVKQELIKDFRNTPFCFKFDETTNSQGKKQYNGYIQYWSDTSNEIITSYCGSLFLGHCNADQMVNHFMEFGRELKWDLSYLLQLGMDGPNLNKAFEQKLSAAIDD